MSVHFEPPSIQSLEALLPAFAFERLIAHGGMGAVYKARQRSLDRDVAIKILPKELGEDPQFRASFEAEAKAMAKLSHPNLIGVFDYGRVDELLYIVMEFVPGKSLHDTAHRRKVEPRQAVKLILAACRGLAHAHENGIIHRDIKPANILLDAKARPKIGDFGLASTTGPEGSELNMGTPGYTAPELLDGSGKPGRQSDIYSIGVMLRELLTGIPADDPGGGHGIVSDPELLKVCDRATHTIPEKRHADARMLIEELEAWMAPAVAEKGSEQKEEAKAHEAPAETSDPKVGANWALYRNLAIIAFLLIAIYLAWTVAQRKQQRLVGQQAPETKEVAPPKQAAPEIPTVPEPSPPVPEPSEPIAAVPDVPEPTPLAVDTETPAQSLIRLREALAAGDRSEMPIGTLSRGSSLYFHVPTPATWQQASRMARSYGGHLPMPQDDPTLAWLAENIPAHEESERHGSWLGVIRPADRWTLATGESLTLATPPNGDGNRAFIHRSGEFGAADKDDRQAFFIEWQRDGSNPTERRTVLAKVAATLGTEQSFFPPETVAFGDRRLLVVEESLDHSAARELARIGGGELMIPATTAEADWLEQHLNSIKVPQGLWIGGELENGLWQWSSGEAWTFARWTASFPSGDGDRLVIVPGKGWQDRASDDPAAGCIIEWSNDQASGTSEVEVPDITELSEKADKLLASFEQQRRKELIKNSETFIWKLEVWLRRRPNHSEIERWKPAVTRLIQSATKTRVPGKLDPKVAQGYHPDMRKIAADSLAKQNTIDADFMKKATRVRDAYVQHLSTAIDEAQSIGQGTLAAELGKLVDEAGEVGPWVDSFKNSPEE
ncbi:MAG: protein kinase [Verrucomicrobiota bacterium]